MLEVKMFNARDISITKVIDEFEIFNILSDFNQTFNPTLTERGLDLRSYSKKLSTKSDFIGAYYKGNCIGLVSFYANDYKSRISYLTLIAVDNNFRRMGIGQLLLDKFLQISLERSMQKAMLEVAINNLSAINFYKKNGFEFFKKSSESFIYMVKNLIV